MESHPRPNAEKSAILFHLLLLDKLLLDLASQHNYFVDQWRTDICSYSDYTFGNNTKESKVWHVQMQPTISESPIAVDQSTAQSNLDPDCYNPVTQGEHS